jgi:hypothetical protein
MDRLVHTESHKGDVIDEMKEQIAVEDDPAELVRMVLCWEGVANSAHHCSFSALQKLREIGWTIVKHSHDPDDKEKRQLVKELLTREYPHASQNSISKYAINFAQYLQMSDEEFAQVDRIRITHIGNKKDKPMSCIGVSELNASDIICNLSSSDAEHNAAAADSSTHSDSDDADAIAELTDGDSESCDTVIGGEEISLRRSNRPRKTAPQCGNDEALPITKAKKRKIAVGHTRSSRVQQVEESRGPVSTTVIASECASACDLSITDRAIATLECLVFGGDLSQQEFREWCAALRTRCKFLARLYGEDDWTILADETIDLLERYEGRQFDPHLEYLEHLKLYGWVISPRMWTAEEIVVLCVIMVDPGLQFNNILQKDKGKSGEDLQNRAMASLDPRVQKVIYSRLKAYGVVDQGHLPEDVPAGVVLNSGGSYLQLATWEYLHCARFVTDPSLNPSLIRVEGAPEYTAGNVVFVGTTTRRPSGEAVYVSLSPLEMHGPLPGTTDPRAFDGTPLQDSLPSGHLLSSEIQKGDGPWATERVLYFESGRIIVQSITAYGTDMRMLELACKGIGQKVTSAKAIVDFNWSTKESIMEALPLNRLPKVRIMKGSISAKHRLSFGTRKIVKNLCKARTVHKPQATRRQQFHKDGPTLYDTLQFQSNGKIKTNARIATVRTEPLPTLSEGRSTSALFSFFARTFLGLKPKSKSSRVCPTQGLRLHAPLGTAIIFYFDTDHQGWKCRAHHENRLEAFETAIHVRAHFYVYSRDIRFMPTSDLEETFEFLACYAQGPCRDEATKMVMLDSLNTFVDEPDPKENPYLAFKDQRDLDNHCQHAFRYSP